MSRLLAIRGKHTPADNLLRTLASNKGAFAALEQLFVEALEAEQAACEHAAVAALLDQTKVPSGCVSLGRCDMLRDIIDTLKQYH